MHDAVAVGLAQRLGELHPEPLDLRDRQRAAAHALRQRLAGHELLRDEELGRALLDRGLSRLVDGGDAGVGQHGRGAGLAQEALAGLGVAGLLRAHELEGHFPAEDAVARPVDDAHAPAAEAAENVEVGDRAWLHERHLPIRAVRLRGSLVDWRMLADIDRAGPRE